MSGSIIPPGIGWDHGLTHGTRVQHKRYAFMVGTVVHPSANDPDRVCVTWQDGHTYWEHPNDLRPTPVQPKERT